MNDRDRWDARYAEAPAAARRPPTGSIDLFSTLFPPGGAALDVACGAGRNALALARLGFRVTGVDVSPRGLALARDEARARGVDLELVEADLATWRPGPRSFDLVLVVDYLERGLFPALAAALRPGGVLLYETFTREQASWPEAHPRRPEHLLEEGELLRAFSSLRVLHYDDGPRRLGDGRRCARARLLARRPDELS